MWLVYWLILKDLPRRLACIILLPAFLASSTFYGTTFNNAYSGGRTTDGHSEKYVNYPTTPLAIVVGKFFWSLLGFSRILGFGTGLSYIFDCFTSP